MSLMGAIPHLRAHDGLIGDDVASPADNVDLASHTGQLGTAPHTRQLSTAILAVYNHPYFLVIISLVGMVLVVTLARYTCCRPRKKARGARAKLPAFDVEGGRGATGGDSESFLHPSIMEAAKNADVAVLKQWVGDERCVIDAQMASDGMTALHTAAQHGHANVVRMLIDHGADTLVVDASLRTPLHLVAMGGHGLCVKALLDAGGDPEGHDVSGKSALRLAEEARHVGTARMMRLHLERRSAEGGAGGGRARPRGR
jgi:hypothetical protein